MSLFVCWGFLWGLESHSLLFIEQQLTSWPLSVPQCQWDWKSGHSLSGHKYSHLLACGHTDTRFILKQLPTCEREAGCAKLIMWRVRTLLNGASLLSPRSEVTLSFQSALQMNWALCQRTVKFISEAEVRAWGHLACWMPSYNSPVLDSHYTRRWAHCVLHACPHKHACSSKHRWSMQIKNQEYFHLSICNWPLILAVGWVAMAMCVTQSQVVSCVEPDKLTGEVWMRH